MVKPYLYINREEDFWGNDTNDTPGRGMSGWLTGPDGAFQLPYRSELKFGTGDYTVIQTFNCLASGGTAVSSYDDHDTTTGIKFSQLSGTFTVDSGDVSVDLPSNLFDGTNQWLLVERDAGVAVNAYVNDFTVVTASGNDTGIDIGNTTPLNLAYDGTTYMEGMLGLTVTFDRLLEEYEKLDMYYWVQSDYDTELEPGWLRDEAVLYINPHDPVQRAEYAARERIINLAVTPPDKVYVRHAFTSADGIDNPVLELNAVSFNNIKQYRYTEDFGYEGGPLPEMSLGHGAQPYKVTGGFAAFNEYVVPVEQLGGSWFNNDWTISFWCKLQADGVASDIITQGGTSVWSITDRVTDDIALYVDGAVVLNSNPSVSPYQQLSMVTVRKDGSNFELFIDGMSVDTAVYTPALTITSALVYSPTENGVLGPMHIWTKPLSDAQIQGLYNATPQSEQVLGSENITVTESFSTQSLNWESR